MARGTLTACVVLAVLGGVRAQEAIDEGGPRTRTARPARRVLRAGAAATDITPTQFPVHMPGLARKNLAQGVHDPLHARALVLDDGATTIAVVVVDNIGVRRDAGDRIRPIVTERCGIAPDKILIASTHTHSAPDAYLRKGAIEAVAYGPVLIEGVADAIVRAHAALRPAAIGHAVHQLPEEVFNRRWFLKPGKMQPNPFGEMDQVKMNPPNSPDVLLRPAGPTDPDITILSVRDAMSRQPLALLANYALHYVGYTPKAKISADYFGVFAQLISSRLGAGEDFVAMMSNGASGDINNRPTGSSRPSRKPFEQIRIVAQGAADAAHRAYETIGEHRIDVRVGMIQRQTTLHRRRPTPEQVERAKAFLAVTGKDERAKLPRGAQRYARSTLAYAKARPTIDVTLQAFCVGDLGVCAIPFEAFAEVGLELKRRSPFPRTMVIGIANDKAGYLPTPDQHKLGGYETWLGTSRVQPEASIVVTDQLLEMLRELAQEG
ncbi:MAG: hypothetical protein HN742_39170 [Lentisphaerae bacterium]|jgi:neutral ceramidase|nr:hypothetical protein [Lentisphaerota bacterium]MBT7054733.1 hypothetical protein [Lentisphaerota bacterium]MBT7847954.1 hypothetical protein [Lentisphaerota bacterium]